MSSNNENKPRCAITGASGYVGMRLAAYFEEAGWHVRRLVRNPAEPGHAHRDIRRYQLSDAPSPTLLEDISVLVHCAYDFHAWGWAAVKHINVDGSRRLFDAAREAGVRRIIYISTMSAYEGCVSQYGRAKLMTEKLAEAVGGRICRPGLVYGRNAGGMMGALSKLVARTRMVPLPGGGQQLLYLAHERDLAACVERLASVEDGVITKPVTAANEQGLMFRTILEKLAHARGRQLVCVPFPWRMAWLGLRVAELAGLRARFRSDSLLSLMRQDPAPDFTMTRLLGVNFRMFDPEEMQ